MIICKSYVRWWWCVVVGRSLRTWTRTRFGLLWKRRCCRLALFALGIATRRLWFLGPRVDTTATRLENAADKRLLWLLGDEWLAYRWWLLLLLLLTVVVVVEVLVVLELVRLGYDRARRIPSWNRLFRLAAFCTFEFESFGMLLLVLLLLMMVAYWAVAIPCCWQRGHTFFRFNHCLRQSTWKMWSHWSAPTLSPSWMGPRQIVQVTSSQFVLWLWLSLSLSLWAWAWAWSDSPFKEESEWSSWWRSSRSSWDNMLCGESEVVVVSRVSSGDVGSELDLFVLLGAGDTVIWALMVLGLVVVLFELLLVWLWKRLVFNIKDVGESWSLLLVLFWLSICNCKRRASSCECWMRVRSCSSRLRIWRAYLSRRSLGLSQRSPQA